MGKSGRDKAAHNSKEKGKSGKKAVAVSGKRDSDAEDVSVTKRKVGRSARLGGRLAGSFARCWVSSAQVTWVAVDHVASWSGHLDCLHALGRSNPDGHAFAAA